MSLKGSSVYTGLCISLCFWRSSSLCKAPALVLGVDVPSSKLSPLFLHFMFCCIRSNNQTCALGRPTNASKFSCCDRECVACTYIGPLWIISDNLGYPTSILDDNNTACHEDDFLLPWDGLWFFPPWYHSFRRTFSQFSNVKFILRWSHEKMKYFAEYFFVNKPSDWIQTHKNQNNDRQDVNSAKYQTIVFISCPTEIKLYDERIFTTAYMMAKWGCMHMNRGCYKWYPRSYWAPSTTRLKKLIVFWEEAVPCTLVKYPCIHMQSKSSHNKT